MLNRSISSRGGGRDDLAEISGVDSKNLLQGLSAGYNKILKWIDEIKGV